jgi:hypothetical protein
MKTKNKYVMLDLDGTIDISTHQLNFDKQLLENVFTLCELYRAKIVLSTSWRFLKTVEEWNKIFRGLVVDKTPMYFPVDIISADEYGFIPYDKYQRGLEVKQWLNENNVSIDDCIIIDDNDEFLPEQQHRFVECESSRGFDKERLNYALELI